MIPSSFCGPLRSIPGAPRVGGSSRCFWLDAETAMLDVKQPSPAVLGR